MTVIKLRRGTAAEWISANSVLAEGELGYETDTRKAKVGNGVTDWNGLSYAFPGGGVGGAVDSVFGRIGDVVADEDDYVAFYSLLGHNHDADYADIAHVHTAAVVTNTPAGNIIATTVQAAINELDSEKSAIGHNHDSSYAPLSHVGTGGTEHANVVAAGAAGFMIGTDKTKLDGIATGANLYVHPNHSGDVTSVADGAQTIADNAVSNAKAANMAQNTIKGRITASTGDPEDLTAANVRTIINVADGANNYSHPNHSGDVTSVGDGAQTIVNNAVSNAKLADMAASSIKINNTGAPADPIDGTVAQVKTLLAYTPVDIGAAAASHPHTSSDITDFATAVDARADARPLSSHAAATASVQFGSQEAINFRVENRTSDPGSPAIGQVWLRTDL